MLRTIRLPACGLFALGLAGCIPATAPPVPPPPTAQPDQCGASRVQKYRGFIASDSLLETVRQESGTELLRHYATGDPVTMDYRATRLNVEVASNGRIAALRCG
jgi:hypothetical protein